MVFIYKIIIFFIEREVSILFFFRLGKETEKVFRKFSENFWMTLEVLMFLSPSLTRRSLNKLSLKTKKIIHNHLFDQKKKKKYNKKSLKKIKVSTPTSHKKKKKTSFLFFFCLKKEWPDSFLTFSLLLFFFFYFLTFFHLSSLSFFV